MSSRTDFDVLIVGGGMVGASLALALAPSGHRIGVLDAGPLSTAAPAATPRPAMRVSALTAASVRFLSRLGVWDTVVAQRVSPYLHMDVCDFEGTGRIRFDADEVGVAELGHIVENPLVTAALLSALDGFDNISLVPDISVLALDTGSQITAGWGYRLKTDAGVMETRLLVGADGAHSSIRKLAGFRTREWDYDHHALVTTLRTEKPHGKTARQWFHPGGPLAFLPLAMEEDHLVSMVLSCRPALADQYQTLSLEALGRKLTHMSEGALGPVEVLEAPVRFPLRQRHATRYVKNGLVLVGDAAHTIHPLAGQGANLGLMDVRDLAHQLEGIRLDDGIRLQSALHAWQRRRMPENLAMMAAMEGFQRLFSEAPGPVRWLRNRGLNLTGQLPLVKRQIIRQAMGLQLFE